MNRTGLRSLAASVLLSLASVATSGNSDDPLKEIGGYQKWTRVNHKPIEVMVDPLALGG